MLRNSFLPHRDNRQHPHLLRYGAIAVALVLVFAIESFSVLQSRQFTGSAVQMGAVLPSVIIALTDQERSSAHLESLESDPLLTQAAQAAADDMAQKGYFAHVSPQGQTPWDWLAGVGYRYQYAGENLAVNFQDSQQLVDAWMSSPTHRANVLSPNYTATGVGMASGTYEGQQVVFVVQFYASPLPAAAEQPTVASAKAPATQAPTTSPTKHPVPATPAVAAAEVPLVSAPANNPPLPLVTRVLSSPRTYATDALLAVAAFFALLLALGFMPFSRHRLHPRAALNGAALVVVVVGVLALNAGVLFTRISLPADTQNSAVIFSTFSTPAR